MTIQPLGQPMGQPLGGEPSDAVPPDPDELPRTITLNAWTGTAAAAGALDARAVRWGSGRGLPPSQQVLGGLVPPNPLDWSDPDVGYAVLLPESAASAADKALGLDAEPPVRELMAARPGTVMLRFDPALRLGLVRRYFPDGSTQVPDLLSRYGTGKGQVPLYVVIVGPPQDVPWAVQYALGTRRAVGRLPLRGEALGNYVTAMLSGWAGADLDVRAPLMWTVDLGDITAQMRAVIATPLAARLTTAQLPRFEHLLDDAATNDRLLASLAQARPALVVTSSHGMAEGTGDQLAATLGLLVDDQRSMIDLAALDAAMPPGAIWHAQACCSAGSEGPSKYTGLLDQGTTALAVVTAVAELGSTVAPAALRLLGRPAPVRAVVGHVEPTFDLTLRVAETQQGLGGEIVDALSANLFSGQPIGYAFREYRSGVGELYTQYVSDLDRRDHGDRTVGNRLTRLRLTALDRQSMVLLGDPTVCLPPLAGAP